MQQALDIVVVCCPERLGAIRAWHSAQQNAAEMLHFCCDAQLLFLAYVDRLVCV
jgi:hypothetical protein